MIGLWAAVALFGGAIWLALDELYVRRGNQNEPPRPRRRFGQLRRALVEADMDVSPQQVVLASASGALVVFVMVYQLMDWLVPSLFAAAARERRYLDATEHARKRLAK